MTGKEEMALTGSLRVLARDEAGRIVQEERVDNLVVTTGRNLTRDLLRGVSASPLSHLAIGTSTTAAAAADSALGTEVHREAITQITASDGQMVIDTYIPTGDANGNTLTEAGLLNAALAGVLFSRTVHSGIAKTSAIAITYEWTINIGAS